MKLSEIEILIIHVIPMLLNRVVLKKIKLLLAGQHDSIKNPIIHALYPTIGAELNNSLK